MSICREAAKLTRRATIGVLPLSNHCRGKIVACGGCLEVGPGQHGRRNLNDMQRAQLALQLEDVVRARAKERQVESGKAYGRGQEKVQANLPEPIGRDSRDELASMAW